jgi:hypothetical protein
MSSARSLPKNLIIFNSRNMRDAFVCIVTRDRFIVHVYSHGDRRHYLGIIPAGPSAADPSKLARAKSTFHTVTRGRRLKGVTGASREKRRLFCSE